MAETNDELLLAYLRQHAPRGVARELPAGGPNRNRFARTFGSWAQACDRAGVTAASTRRAEREAERARERLASAKAQAGAPKVKPYRLKRHAEALERLQVEIDAGDVVVRDLTEDDVALLERARRRRDAAHVPSLREANVRDVARTGL